jgi:hypothetical protein
MPDTDYRLPKPKQQARIAKRCQELGIHEKFAPFITDPEWFSRGENMIKERRKELLEMGVAKAKAIAAAIKTQAK